MKYLIILLTLVSCGKAIEDCNLIKPTAPLITKTLDQVACLKCSNEAIEGQCLTQESDILLTKNDFEDMRCFMTYMRCFRDELNNQGRNW